MGVHGLWKLIEPSGRPVPLETLENKVLAVDVSIWLHQAVKGFQDSRGGSVPNAHLLGIYHRICKLLYFRIKPVFVFDGGVPVLKKQTIAKRNQQKSRALTEAERIKKNLLSTLLKHSAVSKVLSERTRAELAAASSTLPQIKIRPGGDENDLYALPPTQLDTTVSSQSDGESSSSEEGSSSSSPSKSKYWDLHSIDTKSAEFKALPVDVRHEILTDLKESRKQSSWGRIHEMPAQSDDFSGYQMRRLLKRWSVQTALEEAEQEMGGHSLSLGELEKLLKDEGVITTSSNEPVGNRIASDENTRFLLIKDLKQAVEDAKNKEAKSKMLTVIEETVEDTHIDKIEEQPSTTNQEESTKIKIIKDIKIKNKADLEFEDDLKKAIELSLQDEPSTSQANDDYIAKDASSSSLDKQESLKLDVSFYEKMKDEDFDSESSEDDFISKFSSAKSYMMEYSGLTPNEIAKVLSKGKSKEVKTSKTLESALLTSTPIDSTNISNTTKDTTGPNTNERVTIDAKGQTESTTPDVKEKRKQQSSDSDSDFVEVESEVSKILTTNQENEVTTTTRETETRQHNESVESSEKKSEDVVDLVSDSDSDDCIFVEVEEKPVKSMEIVVQPDQTLDDDLFKDVFEEVQKKEDEKSLPDANINKVEENSQKSNDVESAESSKSESVPSTSSEFLVADSKSIIEEAQQSSQELKQNIERLIEQYSKSDDAKKNKEDEFLTVEKMEEMEKNLQKEQSELRENRLTRERMASNITDQMYQETQELLQLFGIPYVIAPMEAEAQCAFLDYANLTDGTITDDSDIWLFGGTTVYKNFFNQNKLVLEYKIENIVQHFKLTREHMILLAMLVGSDYTVGLQGVGPVTALEILAAFPNKPLPSQLISGLQEFRNWFNKGKLPGPGRTSLRSKLKNVVFLDNFPNQQIAEAYLEPVVDLNKEAFTWSKPDITGLIDFAKRKFGWTQKKSEEILNPIIRRMEETRNQASIRDYFKTTYKIDSGEAEKKMSKRVRDALNKIGKEAGTDDEPDKKIRKKIVKKKEEETKPRKKKQTSTSKQKSGDEDLEILKKTEEFSESRIKEISDEIQANLKVEKVKKVNLHRKEVIPQKQKDKADILKNKLKAIETFRKSKKGPGYVKKKGKVLKAPKEDAGYLSESSDD